MKDDPRSHGLWERTAPPAPPTAPLDGRIAVDVAIVGGGFTGTSAALHLAEAGARVALLEGVEIGFGGSGRNVGLVNAGMWVMPDDLPGELGELYGSRLLDLLGGAPSVVFDLIERHGIACEAERRGTLHCAVGRKGLAELQERARQWQARGAPVRLLDAEETARTIGTRAYAGALLDARAGTIQPLAYARGLAAAAIAAGARIYTASPVVAVTDAGTNWRLDTRHGSVEAPSVVVATNAYTSAVWPEIRAELVHLPYFNMATAPLGDNLRRSILPERQGVWDTKSVLSSFRFDRQGRLVFGSVGALRGPGVAIHRDWGRRALARLFPQLRGVPFETEWYGQIGMTANNLPRFHRLGRNVVSFSGYNGRGIAPGTVFGRCLAGLVQGTIGEDDLPLPVTDPVAAPRRRLREAVYEAGAQLAHLTDARF
ncbi:NAD(P)/FAD-dependent oxidoreductase [Methylobacterium frigidaeris]|uniref:Gamma-glutamylputrescine oxidoreductase n=1 Tax=Methylobacterium frigidaeris TaxID=2038277 RepID=A0AA37H9N8_9HYPH|nr:FAD-binding oxidoreductase [Methylobacterium frigidaeris]PIK73885.1 FAD-dependent oxidoreductase [Methylobacterium frigidaeris]GJD61932.1 Gamma-glutamylputrescine oxidoreductase [Methylobacterium frigidaeris]